ncbi:MAG TPA: DUF4012 domain-containing protein [Acidimicrobiales bacterium]|nr:DUF4012 domain-containing protein [Acidimicrobiales bacterium]
MPQSTSTPESRDFLIVWTVVVIGACAAGFAPADPTGTAVIDVIERAALAGVVVWFAARSRPWTWCLLAGAAAVLAGSVWGLGIGLVASALTVAAILRPARRTPVVGALIGALSVQGLLRTAPIGRFGFTALITGVVTVSVVVSGYRGAGTLVQRRIRVTGGALVGFVLIASAGFAFTVRSSNSAMQHGLEYAQNGADSAAAGRQTPAALQLFVAREFFSKAQHKQHSPLMKLAYAVPVLAQHARLVTTAADSGRAVTADALEVVTVAPYRELRGSNGTFDLDRLETMRGPLAATISSTRQTLDRVDAATSPWLLGSLQRRVGEYRTELTDAVPQAEAALQAIDAAPMLLGADRPKRYLVLFANPAESRGLGGFIGAWAELEAHDGKVRLARHGHIDELNDASDWRTRSVSGPQDYLARYSRLQPERYLQNVSASPDFPTVAKVTGELYRQSMGTRIDGVLYVDPIALGALLELTGPVFPTDSWYRIDSDTAADYLMHDQYLRYSGRIDERVDLLSATAEATFEALTEGDLPTLGSITDALSPMVHQGRLLFSTTDPAVQSYLESVGLTGAFPEPRGDDLLSVRISNASTNKADYYLDQTTRYTVRHDPATGATHATARVTFVNHAPSSGEPAYILGNQDTRAGKVDGRPFGSDTVAVSLYSALRPTALSIDGVTAGIQVQRELGAWVGSQTVTIPPGGTMTIEIELEGSLDAGNDYRLTISPQPSARPRRTTVVVQPTDAAGRVVPDLVATRSFDDDRVEHLRVPATVTANR